MRCQLTFPPKVIVCSLIRSLVCEMISWKDKKKTGLITGAVNMFFMLIVCFGYSVIALGFLFLFFVSLLGMGLNIVYRATNDQQV